MAELCLRDLGRRFGTVTAVTDVTLDIPSGHLVCLLGPSGCGKTTLLRLIAGLDAPSEGRILLDGEDITAVPAHQRNFGMVFQSLALFPHLNVADNISYGLRVRGVASAARRKRAEALLELVRLPGIADRHVTQLSGGQRQRVAIARALALEPKIFLLDEPMSALDAKLREAMQVELSQLQRRLGITTVVVTHDQREAMTMADTIVVIGANRVQQVGAPLDIYRRPRNSFVADFIGSINLLPAVRSGPGEASVGDIRLRVVEVGDGVGEGDRALISVRPEDVHLLSIEARRDNTLPGTVSYVRDLGSQVETHVDCAGETVVSVSAPKDRPAVAVGDVVRVELPVAACRALAP
jgi:putative spermidine/putrescine transport system ATP-binding protein